MTPPVIPPPPEGPRVRCSATASCLCVHVCVQERDFRQCVRSVCARFIGGADRGAVDEAHEAAAGVHGGGGPVVTREHQERRRGGVGAQGALRRPARNAAPDDHKLVGLGGGGGGGPLVVHTGRWGPVPLPAHGGRRRPVEGDGRGDAVRSDHLRPRVLPCRCVGDSCSRLLLLHPVVCRERRGKGRRHLQPLVEGVPEHSQLSALTGGTRGVVFSSHSAQNKCFLFRQVK